MARVGRKMVPESLCRKALWMAAVAGMLLWTAASAGPQQPDGPIETGVVEQAGVSLTLLDVLVVDREGDPVSGLTREDFTVRLDGKSWPVYSVDDLCDCPQPDSGREVATSERGAGSPEPTASTDAALEPHTPSDTPERFVLYFDFSQLPLEGRDRAVRQAGRWVEEVMRPDDEAMVAAYATASGLRRLSPFTSDRKVLVGVIRQAYEESELIDPFPEQLETRVSACAFCCEQTCDKDFAACDWCRLGAPCSACCDICVDNASLEYFHGRRSLRALRRFLADLRFEPGRKNLLFFHQNGVLYPGSLFSTPQTEDQERLLEEIGAEATAARTRIHVAYASDGPGSDSVAGDLSVNLGANLALFTGGSYNRSERDLFALIAEAGRGCACTYRVGLVPPDRPDDRVYAVTVRTPGGVTPHRYRLRFLSDLDDWLRDAERALSEPEAVRDLEVSAELLPVRGGPKGWDAVVQVALALDSLLLLPAAEGRVGRWEVGALLTRDDGARTWEMLGLSSMQREGLGESGKVVLHQRAFRKLKPGRYRLAAFVRDAAANFFGGADAFLDLPTRGEPSIVGPALLRSAQKRLSAPLPLWTRKAAPAVRVGELQFGPIPLGDDTPAAGEPLSAVSLLCPQPGEEIRSRDVVRFVSKAETPLFRFEEGRLEPAGDCYRIVDEMETWRMAEGRYAYHLRWTRAEQTAVLEATRRFTLSSPRPVGAPLRARGDESPQDPPDP